MRWLLLGAALLAATTITLSFFMDEITFALTSLPLALAWLLLAPWSMLVFANLSREKRWLAAFFTLLSPALVAAATICTIFWLGVIKDARHFAAQRASYDRVIARMPDDGHRSAEFNWGGLLFASRGVVYDQTDEIMKPDGSRSDAWLAHWQNTDLMCGQKMTVGPVHRMGDHYYMVSFGC